VIKFRTLINDFKKNLVRIRALFQINCVFLEFTFQAILCYTCYNGDGALLSESHNSFLTCLTMQLSITHNIQLLIVIKWVIIDHIKHITTSRRFLSQSTISEWNTSRNFNSNNKTQMSEKNVMCRILMCICIFFFNLTCFYS